MILDMRMSDAGLRAELERELSAICEGRAAKNGTTVLYEFWPNTSTVRSLLALSTIIVERGYLFFSYFLLQSFFLLLSMRIG